MNKLAIVGILGALLVVFGIWYVNNNSSEPVPEVIDNETSNDEVTPTEDESVDDETSLEGEVKEFVVTGSHMSFDPEEIRVNEGDTVRVVFKSSDMPHDFVLDEFDVRTNILPAGQEQVVEFVASQAGEYEYYCSVGNHRALGMVGTLIVE